MRKHNQNDITLLKNTIYLAYKKNSILKDTKLLKKKFSNPTIYKYKKIVQQELKDNERLNKLKNLFINK